MDVMSSHHDRPRKIRHMESSRSIEINGTIYMPTHTVRESREYRSKVLEFDDVDFRGLPRYKYPPLPLTRRRIRLLTLEGSGFGNPEISCEFFEAEFGRDGVVRRQEPEPRRCDNLEVDGADLGHTSVVGLSAPNGTSRAVKYEAVSWHWGMDRKEFGIRIKRGTNIFRYAVSRELALALKYLRRPTENRILWIDTLCINQEDYEERNHQVQMMYLIYNSALQVCVWLGEDTDDSAIAILFTREIVKLGNFDIIAENKDNALKWQSLLLLMQRPWFSRRWVVQEITLARYATIYCGKDEIPWENFAVAVELFVEVEKAMHQLSDVMQKTNTIGHVTSWFDHVSELGASVLVEATGKVFRQDSARLSDQHGFAISNSPAKSLAARRRRRLPSRQSTTTIPLSLQPMGTKDKPPLPRPLLSLEYLVSSLSVFQASQPRDAVYSLLAIARDTSPFLELSSVENQPTEEAVLMSTVSSFLDTSKMPFVVDYSKPYTDVCKDFIAFCIERATSSDPTRALDILCRPWAPESQEFGAGTLIRKKPVQYKLQERRHKLWTRPSDAGFRERLGKARVEPGSIHNAGTTKSPVSRDGTSKKSTMLSNETPSSAASGINGEWYKDGRSLARYIQESWIPKDHKAWFQRIEQMLPKKPGRPMEDEKTRADPGHDLSDPDDEYDDDSDQKEQEETDIQLPSWVCSIAGAAFAMFQRPDMMRIGRKNADPLVGLPLDGHRNYSAAQNTKVDIRKLKFRKRTLLKHHSLYVSGFELDEIITVAEPARLGAIPETWTQLAGWEDAADGVSDPPAQFWRTLIADRGEDNCNPPYYYAAACKETVKKGGLRGGSVDTGALISGERNTMIAKFCRRVQSVIWNRCLIKTKEGRIGLASQNVKPGDLVCILFGCTVPVILRRSKRKSQEDLEKEKLVDQLEATKVCMSRLEQRCLQRIRYRQAKNRAEFKELWVKEIQEETVAINNQMASWEKEKKEAAERKKKEDDDKITRRTEADKRLRERKLALQQKKVELNQFDNQPKKSDEDHEAKVNKRREEANEEDPYLFYTLLGDAYIHGMMDGEAIRHHIMELIPERLFEIR